MWAYIMIMLWLPEPDVLRSQAEDVPLGVDDAGSSATSAYIYADVIVRLDMNLPVRVPG